MQYEFYDPQNIDDKTYDQMCHVLDLCYADEHPTALATWFVEKSDVKRARALAESLGLHFRDWDELIRRRKLNGYRLMTRKEFLIKINEYKQHDFWFDMPRDFYENVELERQGHSFSSLMSRLCLKEILPSTQKTVR